LISAELQVSPRLPTTRDPIRLSATIVWQGCAFNYQAPVVTGHEILLQASSSHPTICPASPPQTFRYSGNLPVLPAGSYTVVLESPDGVATTVALNVTEPVTELRFQGRFLAVLDRHDGSAPAYAVQLTGESGYFWFFDSGNVEVTVKVLDGRAVNGHFWVFVASMTDTPFTLTLTDLGGFDTCVTSPRCPQRDYVSTQGKNTNSIDVTAF
jgi:hypothetical protein